MPTVPNSSYPKANRHERYPAPSRHHRSHRSNWLRAGVLAANDGLISTASLLTGMAAARPDFHTLLLAGAAAVAAGAVSMAAGEYVSVSSQSDTERADMEMEQRELATHPEAELAELAEIYRRRGLSSELAMEVARQLTARNALDAHLKDEICIRADELSNPLQAAGASAAAFVAGALLPLLVILLTPAAHLWPALMVSTLLGLAALGFLSARLGGAPVLPAMLRVVVWGAVAMGVTSAIGKILGVAV